MISRKRKGSSRKESSVLTTSNQFFYIWLYVIIRGWIPSMCRSLMLNPRPACDWNPKSLLLKSFHLFQVWASRPVLLNGPTCQFAIGRFNTLDLEHVKWIRQNSNGFDNFGMLWRYEWNIFGSNLRPCLNMDEENMKSEEAVGTEAAKPKTPRDLIWDCFNTVTCFEIISNANRLLIMPRLLYSKLFSIP